MSVPHVNAAVVKIASRCNLDCSYCYVYHKGDDGWRSQPALMSRQTAQQAIARVAEHCRAHRLDHFAFVFHGGEPLLASPDFLAFFVEQARAHLAPDTRATFVVQTNGILLTPFRVRHLRDLGISIGISMDGTKASHDRWRVDHNGRGSYARVRAGLDVARAEGVEPGLLTVIDLADDPASVFAHLLELKPRIVDFLLPQATWDSPPERPTPTSYADWLLTLFHLWTATPELPFRIRLFEQIVRAVLGQPGQYDAFGAGANATIVIETNGSLEPADVLRVCGNGLTRRGFHVDADTVDAALSDSLMQQYYRAADQLCATCQACTARVFCAGGYLPHRYRTANAFDNPSVYCPDLFALMTAVQDWTVGELPPDIRRATGLRSMREEPIPAT